MTMARSMSSSMSKVMSRAHSGAGVVPAISLVYPVNQTILTEDTAHTLQASSTGNNTVEFYDGAVKLGDGVYNSGTGYWEYAWTPINPDYDVDLKAVGDVSGASSTVKVVVAEANKAFTTLHLYSQNARADVTTGYADPDGGSNAYKLEANGAVNANDISILANYASALSNLDSGFQIWFKAGELDTFGWYFNSGVNVCSGTINVNGQVGVATKHCRVAIVEEREDGWKRIWIEMLNQAVAPTTMTFYASNTLSTSVSNAADGDGIYLYLPRTADGNLPMTTAQGMWGGYESVADGVEVWRYKSDLFSTVADGLGAAAALYMWVIKPTGWTSSGTYPFLLPLPALVPDTLEIPTPMAAFKAFADTYNCVIIIPDEPTGNSWWGNYDNTTSYAKEDFLHQQFLPFCETHLGISTNREHSLLLGYSKSGQTTMSNMLRYSRFGYCLIYDSAYNLLYGNYGNDSAFSTEAYYQAWNPKDILATYASNLTDKKRVILQGYEAFGADMDDFDAALTAQGIDHDYYSADTNDHSFAPMVQYVDELFALAGIQAV